MHIHSSPFQYDQRVYTPNRELVSACTGPQLIYTSITFDNFAEEQHGKLFKVLQNAPNADWNMIPQINQDLDPIFTTYQTPTLLAFLEQHGLHDVVEMIEASYKDNLAKETKHSQDRGRFFKESPRHLEASAGHTDELSDDPENFYNKT